MRLPIKKLGPLKVKPFQETLHGGYCGPASLKMVMDYYGVHKTETEVAKHCKTTRELGTNDSSLKKAALSYGFKTIVKNKASFKDIECWLEKEVPIIVDWFTKGRPNYADSEVPDGHYSVVVGLDSTYIYLQDPEIGKMRKLRCTDFLRVWFDFKKDRITSWEDMIVRQLIAIYPKDV